MSTDIKANKYDEPPSMSKHALDVHERGLMPDSIHNVILDGLGEEPHSYVGVSENGEYPCLGLRETGLLYFGWYLRVTLCWEVHICEMPTRPLCRSSGACEVQLSSTTCKLQGSPCSFLFIRRPKHASIGRLRH